MAGNDKTQVERDAQIAEINRALTAIHITQLSDFARIAEALRCIVNNQPLPNTITNETMEEQLNEIADYINHPENWVNERSNDAAFIELVKEMINQKIMSYEDFAKAERQDAALRHIQEEENRRSAARINQSEMSAANPPTGQARTLGLPEADFVLYLARALSRGLSGEAAIQFIREESSRNAVQTPGLSQIDIFQQQFREQVNSLRLPSRVLIYGTAIFISLCAFAAYMLAILFATWIGASILSAAGWSAGFTAKQIVSLSMNVGMYYIFIDSIWSIYTFKYRSAETQGHFMGYQGIKANAMKAAVFICAAALIEPLLRGAISSSSIGFSMASVAIGAPIAIVAMFVAIYMIAINVSALSLPPLAALEYPHFIALAAPSQDQATQPQGPQIQGIIEQNIQGVQLQTPTPPPPTSTTHTLLVQAPTPTPTPREEDAPLTLEQLREARIKFFSKPVIKQ